MTSIILILEFACVLVLKALKQQCLALYVTMYCTKKSLKSVVLSETRNNYTYTFLIRLLCIANNSEDNEIVVFITIQYT